MTRLQGPGPALLRPALDRVVPYEPGKPAESVQRELGLDRVVKLASNEGPFGPFPEALEAIARALPESNRYPDGGCYRLRQALAGRHGVGFEEIGRTLERDPAACRQLAARGRAHVRDARPRFHVEKTHGLALAEAFFNASRSGDMTSLAAMLADDVSMHADGGGKRTAVVRPICGSPLVLRAHKAFAVLYRKRGSELLRSVFINGLPGFVTREADGELQTTALEIEDGKVAAIYVMRNPDKLRHLH